MICVLQFDNLFELVISDNMLYEKYRNNYYNDASGVLIDNYTINVSTIKNALDVNKDVFNTALTYTYITHLHIY